MSSPWAPMTADAPVEGPARSPDVAAALGAIKEWESLGAPINAAALNVHGYSDDRERTAFQTLAADRARDSIRAWAARPVDNGAVRFLTASVLDHVSWEHSRRTRLARAEGTAGRRRANAERRAALVAQLRDDRDALGLTDGETGVLLGLPKGAFTNMVKTGGTYSLDRVERLATSLRAHAKTQGVAR